MILRSGSEWYNPRNERACWWLACRLAHKYGTKPVEARNFHDIYYFIQETLSKNNIESDYRYMKDFELHEMRFDFLWLSDMTNIHIHWLLAYTYKITTKNNDTLTPPIFDLMHDIRRVKAKSIYIFDSINTDYHTFEYIYKRLKSAYSQKKKRDKNKQEKRKQCNISLSKSHFNMLNDIVNTSGLTKQEAIESLILNYHKNNIDNITTRCLPAPKSLSFKK